VVDHEDPADLGEAAHALRLAQKGVRFVPLGALEDSRVVSYRTSGRKLHAGPAVALSRPALAYGSALSAAALLPGPLNVSYLYPAPERLPNLALSTPVILTGRLNQAPPARGKVTLAGKLEGRMESFDVEYVWEPLKPEAPVRALWANRRVRRLKQLAGRERGDREELLEAVDRVRAEGGLAAAPGG